jgi:hypothetical protein
MWFFFQYWAGTAIGYLNKDLDSYQFGTGIKSQADFCMV